MGAIHLHRIALVTSLNEAVGYKAGIALTRDQMCRFLPSDDAELIDGDDHSLIRVRSEEFDEMFCKLLYAVGNIASADTTPRRIKLYHSLKNDERRFSIYSKVCGRFATFLEEKINETRPDGQKFIDHKPFVDWAKKECGPEGALMALEMLIGLAEDQHRSFFDQIRMINWVNVAELTELFDSESLATPHGKFFDQRFLDFLSHNYASIDEIHWRQFEGLTCEHFHREGFDVEIGKGRDDGSIDARVWKRGKSKKTPPLILVQCKRQKEKVGKVVVKALYSDVLYEKAKRGLVVTSSALSPGAQKVCSARSYPVEEANRDTLKKWINAMRTPYSGIFMGE